MLFAARWRLIIATEWSPPALASCILPWPWDLNPTSLAMGPLPCILSHSAFALQPSCPLPSRPRLHLQTVSQSQVWLKIYHLPVGGKKISLALSRQHLTQVNNRPRSRWLLFIITGSPSWLTPLCFLPSGSRCVSHHLVCPATCCYQLLVGTHPCREPLLRETWT